MIDKKKCIGCGACVSMCPVNAISISAEGKAVIDPNKCIKCKTCEDICPVRAIKIKD